MPNYVLSREIGPLSYRVEKRDGQYRLWLNGCGIGRPRSGKPADEVWEWHATTLDAARKEIKIDARERIKAMIQKLQSQVSELQSVLANL